MYVVDTRGVSRHKNQAGNHSLALLGACEVQVQVPDFIHYDCWVFNICFACRLQKEDAGTGLDEKAAFTFTKGKSVFFKIRKGMFTFPGPVIEDDREV